MVTIRISRGVGSSPKLWAVLRSGKLRTQVGEFDLADKPGWIDEEANGIDGMSGLVWKCGHIAEAYPRKLYASVEEWIADLAREYPDAEVIRAEDEPPDWP